MRPSVIAFVVVLSLTSLSRLASAQVRDRATVPVAALSDAATLADGWQALAAGRHDAAVQYAESILQRRPWDRAALALKISALAAAAPLRGLDAYEQWLASKRPDDLGL